MSISNGQPANQTSFNDAFMSRTTDTSTTGKIAQSNTTESSAPANGALTTEGGIGVLKNVNIGGTLSSAKYKGIWKMHALDLLASGATMTYESDQSFQYIRVEGDTVARILANAPFGASISGINDGDVFRIVGFSDSKTIKILYQDIQYGFKIFGDVILAKGYILEVQYDATMERFLEIGRNF